MGTMTNIVHVQPQQIIQQHQIQGTPYSLVA